MSQSHNLKVSESQRVSESQSLRILQSQNLRVSESQSQTLKASDSQSLGVSKSQSLKVTESQKSKISDLLSITLARKCAKRLGVSSGVGNPGNDVSSSNWAGCREWEQQSEGSRLNPPKWGIIIFYSGSSYGK